jgi:hypothetical protein
MADQSFRSCVVVDRTPKLQRPRRAPELTNINDFAAEIGAPARYQSGIPEDLRGRGATAGRGRSQRSGCWRFAGENRKR